MINPCKSKLYVRLVIALYLCTIALILYSSLYALVQFVLILFIIIQFGRDLIHQSACPQIRQIQYQENNKWVLTTIKGDNYPYDELKIIIHNMFFQLVKLSTGKKNQLLILFNDQMPIHQLRWLHRNSSKN
ncbi:hypothetical protein EP47_12570 [Legionella norrlandica]|uniref:Uncharacterized protein n=1 Tax=Legionella norrlandica TaxID=1498499 RepID=A0A0A2SRW2_9GAMM|nr:hypothetical protein EP47_12570 [Legionella norrlandica]